MAECVQISDGLFLGNLSAATSADVLRENGIRCLVRVLQDSGAGDTTVGVERMLHVSLADNQQAATEDVLGLLESAVTWIQAAVKECPSVLVHCSSGISRSATVVLAYLVHTEQKSLSDAWALVSSKRPVILPNDSLFLALQAWEEKCGGRKSMGIQDYAEYQLVSITCGKVSLEDCRRELAVRDGDMNQAAAAVLFLASATKQQQSIHSKTTDDLLLLQKAALLKSSQSESGECVIPLIPFSRFKTDDVTKTWLCGFVPFHVDEDRKMGTQKVMFGETGTLEERRAIGCFIGMCLGDAIGAPVEFDPVCYDNVKYVTGMGRGKQGIFQLWPGQWTDDSSMGLCVADSLLATYPKVDPMDMMIRFLAWWNCGYNNAFGQDPDRESRSSVGLGGNISNAFDFFQSSPTPFTKYGTKDTNGNGSVMRLAAVPICFHDDVAKARSASVVQSLTTHQGVEAAACCELLAAVIVAAIHAKPGVPARDIIDTALSEFSCDAPSVTALAHAMQEGDDVNRNWNWRVEQYRYAPARERTQAGYVGSYCMDATAMALHCVWSTFAFSEAVLKAANMCGDADSVAAVTGQLAGAIYGSHTIPREWIDTMQRWDGGGVNALRAHMLFLRERAVFY